MGKQDVGGIRMAGRSMFQKIWDDHVVADLGDNIFLLHIDRHIMHDLGGPAAMREVQPRPKTMRVCFQGTMGPGVTAKDLILHLIGTIGAAGGTGYAVEYAGSAI